MRLLLGDFIWERQSTRQNVRQKNGVIVLASFVLFAPHRGDREIVRITDDENCYQANFGPAGV